MMTSFSKKLLFSIIACYLTLFSLFPINIQAQDMLIDENFDACRLPDGWSVTTSYGTSLWKVGVSDNLNSSVKSMNGTCMLYFDDNSSHLKGNTTTWQVQVETSPIYASVYTQITLNYDVHFRNNNGDAALKIYVYDGNDYVEVANYDEQNNTGADFDSFVTANLDLTNYINCNMSVRFEFSDGDSQAAWASVDNIQLVGNGSTPQNLLAPDFNTSCNIPTGWTTQASSGTQNWSAAVNGNIWVDSDGDGNNDCVAYLEAPATAVNTPTTVRLISPTFNPVNTARMLLDVNIGYYMVNSTTLRIIVSDGTTERKLATYVGYEWTTFAQTFDISEFKGNNTQVIFELFDNYTTDLSYWVSVNSLAIRGLGTINEQCITAIPLTVDAPCVSNCNSGTIFEAAQSSCYNNAKAGVWYNFVAPSSGSVDIETNAQFNDIITLFSGGCGGLSEMSCINKDAYGFEGESLHVNGLAAGTTYYIRVSGADNTFGRAEGHLCIEVKNGNPIAPPPANDLCANAIPIILDDICLQGSNTHATFNGPIPSLNDKSQASIWYSFQAPSSGTLRLESGADFADVLTVYSGSCGGLSEVACNDYGQELQLSGLSSGATYYVQVAGYFASVEGNVCMAAKSVTTTAPSNDICAAAAAIAIDNGCVTASNIAAAFDGPNTHTSCAYQPASDVWFSFVTPNSGEIKVKTGADFIHAFAIYSGTCGNLQEVGCTYNPDRCGAYNQFSGLVPNQTYYLQMVSGNSAFGYSEGDFCIEIVDAANATTQTSLRFFLEGAYDNNGFMSTALNDSGLIPYEQPYNTAPWQYGGTECVNIMPTDAVDWILLELRDPNDRSIVVDRKAALLLKDGSVVDVGNSSVEFSKIPANSTDFYITARHRNHIGVMTASFLTLPNGNSYDLGSVSQVFGGNSQLKMLDTGNGIYGAFTGDINGDGINTVADFNVYRNVLNTGNTIHVYSSADLNMDGNITISDFNMYRMNASQIGIAEVRN